MLVQLLLVATSLNQACADCGLVKNKVLLCATHTEEERVAFNSTRKQLASKVDAERIAALETLSRLTTSHVNAPSESVAHRLAEALADESVAVRSCTVALLGPPQHAIVSMESLLAALTAAEKELQRLLKEQEKLRNKKVRGPTLRGEKVDELEADLASNEREQASLLAWRRTILTQLGLFPDDRVVAALSAISGSVVAAPAKAHKIDDFLDKWEAYKQAIEQLPGAMDVNAPLVRLGSREALRTVVENLTVLQAEIEDLQQPNSYASSGLVGLRNMVDALLHGLIEARRRTTQEICAVLAEKALEEPLLEGVGLTALLFYLQQNSESFPDHLPGVKSPVW